MRCRSFPFYIFHTFYFFHSFPSPTHPRILQWQWCWHWVKNKVKKNEKSSEIIVALVHNNLFLTSRRFHFIRLGFYMRYMEHCSKTGYQERKDMKKNGKKTGDLIIVWIRNGKNKLAQEIWFSHGLFFNIIRYACFYFLFFFSLFIFSLIFCNKTARGCKAGCEKAVATSKRNKQHTKQKL